MSDHRSMFQAQGRPMTDDYFDGLRARIVNDCNQWGRREQYESQASASVAEVADLLHAYDEMTAERDEAVKRAESAEGREKMLRAVIASATVPTLPQRMSEWEAEMTGTPPTDQGEGAP